MQDDSVWLSLSNNGIKEMGMGIFQDAAINVLVAGGVGVNNPSKKYTRTKNYT